MEPVENRVLDILAEVTGTDEVRQNPGLALFERDILDSLGMVELMVALSDTFGIDISPAEIERDMWATPALITAYVEERVRARA